MARSRAIDLWRQFNAPSAPVVSGTGSGDELERSVDQHPASVLERQQEATALRRAVGDLPVDQREALVLYYWGGLTSEQVARYVGVPLGTAKSRIRLALGRLRGGTWQWKSRSDGDRQPNEARFSAVSTTSRSVAAIIAEAEANPTDGYRMVTAWRAGGSGGRSTASACCA